MLFTVYIENLPGLFKMETSHPEKEGVAVHPAPKKHPQRISKVALGLTLSSHHRGVSHTWI
jgi:hypothetical protein